MPTIKEVLNQPEEFKRCVERNVPYKPLSVKFKIVNRCNLRCKMCNHWRRHEEQLPAEFYYPAIKDLIEMGCRRIHFTGGEPLLYADLFSLMQFVRQCNKEMRVSMTSNGTLIDDHVAKTFAEFGLRKANISIDSPDSSVHDVIRGVPGAFDKACAGLQSLRKYLPSRPISINTVVSPWNYRTLSGFPKLAKEIGASGIHFTRLNIHTEEVSRFTPSQIEEYHTEILPVIFEEAKKYNIPLLKSQLDVVGEDEHHNYYKRHKCYALYSHLLINFLGIVYPCCNLMEMPMGDLHHNSIKEIWYGENYQRIRAKETLPIDPNCIDCDMLLEDNLLIDEQCFGEQQHSV